MSPGHENYGHEHHGAAGHYYSPRVLPASLAAPAEVLTAWRTRLLIVGGVAALVSLLFLLVGGAGHILRAYLLGYMICFGFAGGGLAMLMVQYVSGGKWGLLLRRPLEAMSRTLPLVGLMLIPILVFMKHLYQWAAFPNAKETAEAYARGLMTQ